MLVHDTSSEIDKTYKKTLFISILIFISYNQDPGNNPGKLKRGETPEYEIKNGLRNVYARKSNQKHQLTREIKLLLQIYQPPAIDENRLAGNKIACL